MYIFHHLTNSTVPFPSVLSSSRYFSTVLTKTYHTVVTSSVYSHHLPRTLSSSSDSTRNIHSFSAFTMSSPALSSTQASTTTSSSSSSSSTNINGSDSLTAPMCAELVSLPLYGCLDPIPDYILNLRRVGKESPALKFQLQNVSSPRARAAVMTLPHGPVHTPVFMPVGTQGTIKGLTSLQVSEDIGCEIILGNTYHLGLRPGADLIERRGGLHKFMNWKNNILTDSGGFQMVSLVELAEITERGVAFQSPVDGSSMLLTPEKSVGLQNSIGSDIVMALDDVVSSLETDYSRVELATHRTIRWIDRCISAQKNGDTQNLFGIVQGGLHPNLRDLCLDAMVKRSDWLPGYAIGGLAGGESKDKFWPVVKQCCEKLPKDKPRYLMGVGYPLDLLVCVALGVDMFDCVWPCRTARFGSAIISSGLLNLKKSQYLNDTQPLDPQCKCPVCAKYTRSYICSLFQANSPLPCHLLTLHNLHYMKSFMWSMRQSILNNQFETFGNDFLECHFPTYQYPQWVVDALGSVGFNFRNTPVKPVENTQNSEKKTRATNMRSCVLDGEEDENPALPSISRKEKKNRKEQKKEFLQHQKQQELGEAAVNQEAALEKEAEQAEIDEDRDELNLPDKSKQEDEEEQPSKKAKI